MEDNPLKDSYQEIREQLRRQYSINASEVSSKGKNNPYSYGEYRDDMAGETRRDAGFPSIRAKVFLFFACIMLFSCYLYGGQDVKKGAVKAWNELGQQISAIGEKQPYVKKAVDTCTNGYREIKQLWDAIAEETE